MPKSNARELRQRIGSVETVVSVTSAMKTVAAIKLQKVRTLLAPAKEHYESITSVWRSGDRLSREEVLRRHEPDARAEPPDFERRISAALSLKSLDDVYVVFTADRGLVGAYTSDVVRRALHAGAGHPRSAVITIGRIGNEMMQARGAKAVGFGAPDPAGASFARYLSSGLCWLWDKHAIRSHLIYTRFITLLRREIVVVNGVPFPAAPEEDSEDQQAGASWEPDQVTVLRSVARQVVFSSIYLALVESRASELAARVTSMDSAAQKADELLEDLRRQFNSQRRERITAGLIEVTSQEAQL